MAENKLADLSTDFAVQILELTGNIKGHYSLANQLERSDTSIGANIREAKHAHSRADFAARHEIFEPVSPDGVAFRRFLTCPPRNTRVFLRRPHQKSLENHLPSGAKQF